MPESANNRKKGVLYSVFAPTVKGELAFLNSTKTLYFRHLYKYFLEKSTSCKLYGAGLKKYINNKDGEITELLDKNKNVGKNLSNIDGVTTFLPTNRSDTLKNFNVLYEINHMTDMILSNDHDKRIVSMKVKDLLNSIKAVTDRASLYKKGFADYSEKVLIIPVNLWLTGDEYTSTTIYSKTSKNILGQMIYQFGQSPNLYKSVFGYFTKVVLVSDNNIMVIDNVNSPKDVKETYISDVMKKFIKKCRSSEIVEDDTSDDNQGLEQATVQTKKELDVEKILEKSKIDPDTVSSDKKEKLANAIKVKNEPSETKPNTVVPVSSEIDDTDVELDLSGIENIKSSDDIDIIIQARTSGQSIENYKRNQMLKEKYKTMSIGNRSIEDIVRDGEKYSIPELKPDIDTTVDGLKDIKAYGFEKAYNKQLADYDFANILLHFATTKPALYLVKDVKVEDISDTMNKLYRYTVVFEDENRKRHQFSFKMPKMYQEKYCFINEQKWNIIHQKVPYPVTKVGPNMCQVATNYNKIFISRYGANISSKITKLKKVLMGTPLPKNVSIVRGDATKLNSEYLTSIEFDELASVVIKLYTNTVLFNFVISENNNSMRPNIEGSQNFVCIGTQMSSNKKRTVWLDGTSNKVFIENEPTNLELSDFIIKEICSGDPTFDKEFDNLSAGTKFTYTRAKVLALDVPLILFLGAADPGGLLAVLEKAKINHEFTTKRPAVDKDNQGVVAFSDGWLVFDRYPYENSLLLNGLSSFPTREFSFYDMGTRDTYVEIFDLLFNRRNLIDGIENFYYLLIDPITLDVLRKTGLPDSFTELILYANGLLADNSYNIDSNYDQSRLRSNEIINAYLYRELCSAFAPFKDGRAQKFAIPEDAVIKDILESNIVDSHSKLNMALEAENDGQVKLKGPGGMNEDRSFTLEKRAYHPSMKGIIGMNSTPSGEVGINRHMTINSNIVDVRGFVNINKNDYDGTELITPGEALQTFGPESADIERVAMAISQSKHVVPTANACAGLVTYDMERVMPYISNDFSFTAKQDGKVIAIDHDVMIVQYKDGSYDDIDLSEHPDKNTDGGFYIMNQLTTDFKIGESFKSGEILAYDHKYINNNDMFGDLTANVGTLATVAIECSGNVYEDSCYITDDLAHRLATKLTQEKNVIISKFANIKYIVKRGQSVKANDPLMMFDDTADEFASQLLAGMAEEAEDTDEVIATTAPVITKVTGVVKDIKIYYTVPLEEMTPSLRKIVEMYNKDNSAREKAIAKYIDPRDANTILTPAKQVTPDSTGRVKGVKVGDGVLIEFYIEYEDIMGVGDKLT